jgi:hypothetical protein
MEHIDLRVLYIISFDDGRQPGRQYLGSEELFFVGRKILRGLLPDVAFISPGRGLKLGSHSSFGTDGNAITYFETAIRIRPRNL